MYIQIDESKSSKFTVHCPLRKKKRNQIKTLFFSSFFVTTDMKKTLNSKSYGRCTLYFDVAKHDQFADPFLVVLQVNLC